MLVGWEWSSPPRFKWNTLYARILVIGIASNDFFSLEHGNALVSLSR